VSELEIHPPAYPLSRDAFSRALITGHGRALIHAENFGTESDREEILKAATTCLVYDSQIDGYREWWLARLCNAAGLIGTMIDLPPVGSDEDRGQRAAVLKRFFEAGHETALSKLYEMCCFDEEGHEIAGCQELIDVDGERGLIFIAQRLGARLLQDPDYWVTDWELTFFDDLYGTGCGKAILSEAAAGDARVRIYLEKVLEAGEKPYAASGQEQIEPVERILEWIKSSPKREMRLRRWGRRATTEDRAEIVKLFGTESSPIVLTNALICFIGVGFPSFDEALLRLVFHEDDGVRFYACRAFAHHDEPQVRSAALALLHHGDLANGTEMLQLSGRSEDSAAILSTLARNHPGEENHEVLSNLIQLLEKNDAIREPRIPLYVYEFSPCMRCRERAVEALIQWGACPQWLLDEAAQDASVGIRLMVECFDPPANPQVSPNGT
jgi:hypothetical protein